MQQNNYIAGSWRDGENSEKSNTGNVITSYGKIAHLHLCIIK